MPILSRVRNTLRTLAGRGPIQQDLDEELCGYLETIVDEKVAAGMSPDRARREARLEMGGVEQVKEEVRDARPAAWLDHLVRDIRFSLRLLAKTPGFSLTAVLLLALGIGANSAMFGLLNLTLFQAPPGADQPGTVVSLHVHDPARADSYRAFTYAEYETIRDQSTLFRHIMAHMPTYVGVTNEGETHRLQAALVTRTYFETMGVGLIAGRTFTRDEERPGSGAAVVVLSYTAWQRMGGRADILGRTLVVNARPFTVIGVAPERFAGPVRMVGPDFWMPIGAAPLLRGRARLGVATAAASDVPVMIVGRLHPGLSVDSANAALRALSANLQSTRSAGEGAPLVIGRHSHRPQPGQPPAGTPREGSGRLVCGAPGCGPRGPAGGEPQRRQHAVGARRKPAQGDRHAPRPWRRPHRRSPATAGRRTAAGAGGRRRGPAPRRVDDARRRGVARAARGQDVLGDGHARLAGVPGLAAVLRHGGRSPRRSDRRGSCLAWTCCPRCEARTASAAGAGSAVSGHATSWWRARLPCRSRCWPRRGCSSARRSWQATPIPATASTGSSSFASTRHRATTTPASGPEALRPAPGPRARDARGGVGGAGVGGGLQQRVGPPARLAARRRGAGRRGRAARRLEPVLRDRRGVLQDARPVDAARTRVHRGRGARLARRRRGRHRRAAGGRALPGPGPARTADPGGPRRPNAAGRRRGARPARSADRFRARSAHLPSARVPATRRLRTSTSGPSRGAEPDDMRRAPARRGTRRPTRGWPCSGFVHWRTRATRQPRPGSSAAPGRRSAPSA